MPKFNLDEVVTDIYGKPLKLTAAKDSPLATVKATFISSLLVSLPPEIDNPTIEERLARHALALKVLPGGEMNLVSDEIVTIKKVLPLYCNTETLGQMFAIIKKAEQPKKEDKKQK